jgi:hypothetical protein
VGEHDGAVQDVTMGDVVTFELVFTLPEANGQAVELEIELPNSVETRLTVISSEVTFVGTQISGNALTPTQSGVSDGTTIVFDFGSSVNNAGDLALDDGDEIRVEVQARVADVPSNVNGAQLTVNGGTSVVSNSVALDIIEPLPSLNLGEVGTASDAGDTTAMTVTVDGSAMPSSMYNLQIVDAFGQTGAVLVTGTVGISAGVGLSIATGQDPADVQLQVQTAELAKGQTAKVNYYWVRALNNC